MRAEVIAAATRNKMSGSRYEPVRSNPAPITRGPSSDRQTSSLRCASGRWSISRSLFGEDHDLHE
jgi:hypothetical protein